MPMQGDVVETSDAEEEEIQVSNYIYWKKGAKHEASDRNDDNSPKKRLKLGHARESLLETPSSSQPALDPIPSSPYTPFNNTPESSAPASSPPSHLFESGSDVWNINHGSHNESNVQEYSQDPLLLASQTSPQISKPEPDFLVHSFIPVNSLHSDDSEPPPLVLPVHAAPKNPSSPMQSAKPPPSLPNSPKPSSNIQLPSPVSSKSPGAKTSSPLVRELFSSYSPISFPSPPASSRSDLPMGNVLSSPLTPTSPKIHMNSHDSLFGSPLSDNPQAVPSTAEVNHDDVVAPQLELDTTNIPDPPRYSLRQRGANQLKPYTIEKIQYKMALSSNPDAIVRFRSPRRRYLHGQAAEDSQEQWETYVPDEDEPWEESQRLPFEEGLRGDLSGSRDFDGVPGTPIQFSEFLQDLPSTDEDEAKELKALSKEAKKAARKRKEKETKQKLYEKQPKSFPLTNDTMPTGRFLSQRESGHFNGTHVTATSPGSLHHRMPHETHPSQSPSPSSQASDRSLPLLPLELLNGDDREVSLEMHSGILTGVADSSSEQEDDDTGGGRPELSRHDFDYESDDEALDGALDRKSMKVLNRLFPTMMLKHLAKDAVPSKRLARKDRRSAPMESGSDGVNDESSELRPGQTRTRWAKQSKGDMEIKGDTESSDDERISLTDSDSEGMLVGHHSNQNSSQMRTYPEVITISDSSEDQDSSDDGVDDETIQAYLEGKAVTKTFHRRNQRGEGSLIDWMLNRARTVGGPKKVKTRKRSSSDVRKMQASRGTNYKLDIITHRGKKIGRERQSKLNFDHQSKYVGKRPSNRGVGSISGPTAHGESDAGEKDDFSFNHPHDEVHVPLGNATSQKKVRKDKAKERRTRAKANGVYTFGSNDMQVVTGRRARGMVTIDIEEDDFNVGPSWCYATAPPKRVAPGAPEFADGWEKFPSSPRSRDIQNSTLDEPDIEIWDPATKHHSRKIKRPGDFGVPLLHSGLSFAATTFVGRGGLRELCEILSSSDPPPPAVSITTVLRGIEIGPSTSLEGFTKSLRGVLGGSFDFATGLPTLDSVDEGKEWSDLTRVCCRFLSWKLSTWGEEECSKLRTAVETLVSESVRQLRGLRLEANRLDIPTFSLCWFMVELSIRLSQTIQPKASNSLSEAVGLLIHYLLEFDIEKTLVPIVDGLPLDSSMTAGYTAELWVCLFHTLDVHYRPLSNPKQPHPFWLVFQKGLESASSSMNPLAASEMIWKGIFSLCALTQFSIHGMTLAKSRLPANWDLVVLALKKVSLNPNPTTDGSQSNSQLDKRDIYANLAVRRCVDLSYRWDWSLEQSSSLFNQLAEIFRSRKFANLRHETWDYPLFMRNTKWDLDSDYRRGDSAFVLFLRLLVKAADYDPTNPTRLPSPRAKKLLSLAIPVGSLSFSKSRPTAIQDLSTLSVRLAAIAVGIHVDPTSHASRIAHARTYIDFSDADDTTRNAVIRGIRYLAALMVTWKVPLDAIAEWIKAVAGVLVDELKIIPRTDQNSAKRNGLLITIQLLVGCVRQIFETHQVHSVYPEPTLLGSLVRIFFISSLSSETKTLDQLRLLIETALKARAKVMGPPARPRLAPMPTVESQESQDDYGNFDLDFDDPTLLAALGEVQGLSAEQTEHAGKEEKMRQAVKTTQSQFLAWRSLNAFIKDPQTHKGDREYFRTVNSWINCWVGATLLGVDGGNERATATGWILKLWDPFRESLQRDILDRRQRRVDVTVMLRLLQLEPMSYLEIQDRYFKTLMTCLIATEVDLDSEFVSILFSIDGLRHALLVGVPCERESETVDFRLVPEEFERASLDILQRILVNIAVVCDEGAPERDKYLDLVKGMLSTMRRLSMDDSWKGRPGYMERCDRVVRMVSEHLGSRITGLAFFLDWGRLLRG